MQKSFSVSGPRQWPKTVSATPQRHIIEELRPNSQPQHRSTSFAICYRWVQRHSEEATEATTDQERDLYNRGSMEPQQRRQLRWYWPVKGTAQCKASADKHKQTKVRKRDRKTPTLHRRTRRETRSSRNRAAPYPVSFLFGQRAAVQVATGRMRVTWSFVSTAYTHHLLHGRLTCR